MSSRVRLSTLAGRDLARQRQYMTQPRDLARQRQYMTQPGAGRPAARKLAELLKKLDRLPEEVQLHAVDRFRPGYRAAVVGDFIIQFRPDKAGRIFVRRIFGPGQHRS